jgi:hypothetical protein
LTSLDLDTIRQKSDQAPKQQKKKQIQRAMQKQSKRIGRYTRKIAGTLLHQEDSDFRINNRQDRPQEEEGFIRAPPFRRYSTPRYQTIFFGLCYACNNFGHKTLNCRANKNSNNFESYTQRDYLRRPSDTQRGSYNRFESLSTEVECYKCNNFGHMAKDCRMTVPPK